MIVIWPVSVGGAALAHGYCRPAFQAEGATSGLPSLTLEVRIDRMAALRLTMPPTPDPNFCAFGHGEVIRRIDSTIKDESLLVVQRTIILAWPDQFWMQAGSLHYSSRWQ